MLPNGHSLSTVSSVAQPAAFNPLDWFPIAPDPLPAAVEPELVSSVTTTIRDVLLDSNGAVSGFNYIT